ncbi:alpha/beta fold hydrolase [Pararhodobacter oceanensis]|uniref:alpha/beta fold hydrolase n=1 Tax=Pararhodobacter oceanensis TaxID=2172121 RepID=UPI003A907645
MIHTRRFGQPEGLPSVLVHCFLGHAGTWRPLVERITPPLDALAFDMPGHGRSPMPEGPCDLQAEVAGVIEGFVNEPSLLIGHSFGAVSALRFALYHPERVLGLVLIEPVLIAAALADPAYTPDSEEPRYSVLAREGAYEAAAQDFFTFNDPSRDWDALPEAARKTMARQMRLVAATEPGAVHDSGKLLVPGLMEAFTPPVLLIGGDRSPEVFPAILKALNKRFTAPRSATIAGAGHMVPLTHLDETSAVINRWLAEKVLVGDAAAGI